MKLQMSSISSLSHYFDIKSTDGRGAASVVKPASNAVAPTVPRRTYICLAKRENPPAAPILMNALDAIADAAIGRYAVTRYVKIETKHHVMPTPKGTNARMGTIQGTFG